MQPAGKLLILTLILCLFGCEAESTNKSMVHGRPAPPPTDPEVVVVIMAGWTQTAWTMEAIERSMVRKLKAGMPGYRIRVSHRLAGLLPEGDSELFLALEYEGWKARKATPAGRADQFVAVGHSSGATAIYNLLQNGSNNSGSITQSDANQKTTLKQVGDNNSGVISQAGAASALVIEQYGSGGSIVINQQ